MKLLITGAWRASEEELSMLRNMGHEIYLMPDERGELPCAPNLVEGVVCNGLFLHHKIEDFSSLKLIQLTSAGLDRVPVNYINEKGIALKNARGVYSAPMAEYAVWGVLSLYKGAFSLYKNQSEKKWNKVRSVMELSDKRVLIVGCGSVGGECAKRFSAMGCRVVGVDVVKRADENYREMYSIDDLDALIPQSDIIVLTLPYAEENRHLIKVSRIAEMKESAVLVNIARGGVIDTDALTEALKARRIYGAVLDVFETEPLSPDSPLWGLENVIITPHNSFVGENNAKRLSAVIMGNLSKE